MPNYYDSEAMDNDASSPSEAESDESKDKSEKKESKGSVTALLPKSILMGKKFNPGEEVVLKIVHEYGDEIEVEYATGKEDKKEKSINEDSGEMKSSMDQLESSYS